MSSKPLVLYETITRNIRLILLNRPEKRNAINICMLNKLKETLTCFQEDDEAHVAILAGQGGNFCAGYDLNEVVDRNSGKPILNAIEASLLPLANRLSDKTVIASVEGHAAGFGYELALRCQFRVAERDSRMGFMNRRFGMPILNGGTVILPGLIGHTRAIDLIATGRAQPATEALAQGVIHHIADVGCSIGKATNLARSLIKFHQPALQNDLSSFYRQCDNMNTIDLLRQERDVGLKYLRHHSQPMTVAVSFLEGKLCRHGKFNLGNLQLPYPEVTL